MQPLDVISLARNACPGMERSNPGEAMRPSADPFFEAYDRQQIAYGDRPSAPLEAYLRQVPCRGAALDLGAGAGRDTLELARRGFDVTAVDLSERGLKRVLERAEAAGVADRVTTRAADVRQLAWQPRSHAAIVATTVLDHLPPEDAATVWRGMCDSLADGGVLYAEVHTTDDPGCDAPPGSLRDAPVSETAGAVVNYFPPNRLAMWAAEPRAALRILRYEERLEWDYTHGPEHLHGKAILLAVRAVRLPNWYGQPAAFPRRDEPDS